MTPTFTRGPGEALGVFMLESAMDELAYALEIDPVELRLINHGPNDPRGNPWSSDGLPECLRRGAELFGWADATPRRARARRRLADRHRHGRRRLPGRAFMPATSAGPHLHRRQRRVQTATPEFGTGVATMMTQVAADALGLPLASCSYKLGDSDLPNITAAVGSAGSMMVSAAVHAAANDLRDSSSPWPSPTSSPRSTVPIRPPSTSRMGG